MIDKQALCAEIRRLYPDIGECGIDVKAEYDEDQKNLGRAFKKRQSRFEDISR